MNSRSKLVFLSYSHADEAAVTRVYQHLRAAGFEPWMDKFSLPPGKEWRDEIDRAIRRSGAFLSLLSHSSLDRAGILRGEMKLALDLRAERLDDGGILIPVRLEDAPLPKELQPIQALDWFLPDGPAKLTAALAVLLEKPSLMARLRDFAAKPWVLAVALLCLAAGMGARWQIDRQAHARLYGNFLLSRPGSPHPPPSSGPPQLGLTLWRVTEDNASGEGACGFLRFRRQPLSQPVHAGGRLRLDVQASRPGYIYVISRELHGAETPGPPRLLFPVSSVNNGRNQIAPGVALLIPQASDQGCETLQLTHAGTEEQVTVLFSDKPLDQLPLRPQPGPVDPAFFAALESTPHASSPATPPAPAAPKDLPLPDAESRDLNYTSAGPDAVFTAPGTTPLFAQFALKTVK